MATAVLVTLSLAASPTLAQAYCCFEKTLFALQIPGIASDGDFTEYGGELRNIVALINTCTGKFCFRVCGYIANYSGSCHCYSDYNFFVYDVTDDYPAEVSICHSCFCVSFPCNDISRYVYAGFAHDNDDI
jgi:hypothetical protein